MSEPNISIDMEDYNKQRVLALVITKTHTTIKYKQHELVYRKRLSIPAVRAILEKLERLENAPEDRGN